MADSYDRNGNEGGSGGFVIGLLTGTVLGAGLGMLLAPKAGSEIRGAIGEQARNLGNMASEQYKKDAPIVRQSQEKALEQARAMEERAQDPRTKPLVENVVKEMESAVEQLAKA